jgi:hypothetical protein
MNVVAAPTKQPAPAAAGADAVRVPRVGDDVYYFDTSRPSNEFGGIGQGPFTARVVQVVNDEIAQPPKPTLTCVLKIMTPGGDLLYKVGHKTTIAETRAHRYWEWPSKV